MLAGVSTQDCEVKPGFDTMLSCHFTQKLKLESENSNICIKLFNSKGLKARPFSVYIRYTQILSAELKSNKSFLPPHDCLFTCVGICLQIYTVNVSHILFISLPAEYACLNIHECLLLM